jgi:hypothetical protein
LKLEGKLENNYNFLENLENTKKKSLAIIQNKLNINIRSLEDHKKKTNLIYRDFDDLKNKLERQNKIYETEIINKKQENEKVKFKIINFLFNYI